MRTTTPLLDAALEYATRGWHVHPVETRGKRPLTKNGFKDATTDPEQIRRWWRRWPDANIGIALGASGLGVIDVDPRNGGDRVLEALEDCFGPLPETLRSLTGGGGEHRIFAGHLRQSGKIAGVDIKGDGGYIIAPPSVTDGPYVWDASWPESPAPVDDRVRELAEWDPRTWKREVDAWHAQRSGNYADANGGKPKPKPTRRVVSNPTAYAKAVVDDEANQVAGKARDSGRNNQLNESAFKLGEYVAQRTLGRDEVEQRLYDACITNGLIEDDGEQACRATIRSGLDAGVAMAEPSNNAQRSKANAVERMRERLHIGSAVCDLPPLRSLADGLLFTPGESVLYSPPKFAKTFTALDLALSVGTGRPFMSRAVTQGPVLYIAAEGVGGLGARIRAWQRHHGIDNIDAVAFLAVPVNLLEASEVDAVIQLAREMRAVLVVIDTLARCAPGADENSAKDMGRIVQAIDRVRDATGHVCVVHHAGKDATKGMRGSTALLGAVDTVIELSRAEGGIKMSVTAQKDAEPPEPWICHLVSVEDSAVIVVTRPALGDEERQRMRNGAVKQTMVKLIGATPGIGRSKLLRSGLGVRPDTARHLLDELIKEGRIVDDEPGLRLCDTATPRDTYATPTLGLSVTPATPRPMGGVGGVADAGAVQ